MFKKPLLITFEGIEGSGKSTNLEVIKNLLDNNNIKYIVTREPGGGPIGPHIRELLLNKDNSISPSVEMLLMMADRKDHVDNLIEPNLTKGTWVISDRYLDSTIAYQGGGRQLNLNLITALSEELKLPTPDLTLLFDLSVDLALERAKKRKTLEYVDTVSAHTSFAGAIIVAAAYGAVIAVRNEHYEQKKQNYINRETISKSRNQATGEDNEV